MHPIVFLEAIDIYCDILWLNPLLYFKCSVHPVGSRFITKKLDIATTGEIVLLYNEITPEVPRLVYNVFANSAIMKVSSPNSFISVFIL